MMMMMMVVLGFCLFSHVALKAQTSSGASRVFSQKPNIKGKHPEKSFQTIQTNCQTFWQTNRRMMEDADREEIQMMLISLHPSISLLCMSRFQWWRRKLGENSWRDTDSEGLTHNLTTFTNVPFRYSTASYYVSRSSSTNGVCHGHIHVQVSDHLEDFVGPCLLKKMRIKCDSWP